MKNFFSIYENYKITIIKGTKKSFKKKHVKDIKIFLKKKKIKDKTRHETDIRKKRKKKEIEKKRLYHLNAI